MFNLADPETIWKIDNHQAPSVATSQFNIVTHNAIFSEKMHKPIRWDSVVGLLDVGHQQWKALHFLESVRAQGPIHALPFLESIHAGALLLFDLGYFSFSWL